MYTDNFRETLDSKEIADSAEDSPERELGWLLDMDLSEPEERLFAIEQASEADTGLTDYELAVARRPMTRGATGADNLESYVNEEIVMSSQGLGSDIYVNDSSAPIAVSDGEGDSSGEYMAIDYSRPSGAGTAGLDIDATDGVDILGLADDDDMGDKYLVIKRFNPAPESGPKGPVTPVAATSSLAPDSIEPEAVDGLIGSTTLAENLANSSKSTTSTTENAHIPEENAHLPASVALADTPGHSPGSLTLTEQVEQPPESTITRDPVGESPDSMALADSVDESFDAMTLADSVDESFDAMALADSVDESFDAMTLADSVDESFDAMALADSVDESFDAMTLADMAQQSADSVTLADRVDHSPESGAPADTAEHLGDLTSEPMDSAIQQAAAVAQELHGVPALRLVGPGELLTVADDTATDLFVAPIEEARTVSGADLPDEDFALPTNISDEGVSASAQEPGDTVPSVEAEALDIFGDEAFATDALAEASVDSWRPDASDIDDIFADIGEPGTQPCGDVLLGDPGLLAVAESERTDDFNVFAEDLFADESGTDVELAAVSSEADIEALFASLDPVSGDDDEVPEQDMQEIFEVSGHLQLIAGPEVDKALEPEVGAGNDLSFIPPGIAFSRASPGGGEVFPDFLDAFIEEGSSELEKLEDAVALWEKNPASEDALAVVGRILHTLKGIAKGVGLQFYGTLVHNFETLLSAMPRPEAGAEGDYFRIVNAWLDACVRGLDYMQDARADITSELPQPAGQSTGETPQPTEQELRDTGESSVRAAVAAPRPESPKPEGKANQGSNKIADDGARALAAQQSVRITPEKLDQLLNLSNQAQQLSVRTAQSVTRSKRASTEMQTRLASVRAHIAAIADRALRSVAAKGVQPDAPMDALEMDQYSELQEAANILRESVEDLADLVDFATRQNGQVEALLKQQAKVISSIGTSIRGARVVPVSRLIPGLRRVVRTVSVDLGKTVSFKVLNELGTLDRDDYARCQVILDHMVRNALDHGIESADERTGAGKPADGLVSIDIRKAGADAIITLTDDGRGIDPERMRESARKKGLDVDTEALTDAEAARLIFHKGFSTASSVSQISGRGVGMDIVLTELQEMGGDIQVDSVPGRGTSFHIRIPSSIAVNGALLVSAGQCSYAIPLGGLIAVEQVPVEEFFAAVKNGTRLSLAGMECEPAYLATLFQSGHSLDANTWQHNVPVIIAGSPERYMAIAIDDVEEALELVIRSLGTQFATVPGVAGATTTAAGEAIVALDMNLLVASVGAGDQSAVSVDAGRDEELLVMVVDDSRTQRTVATSQLETVGVETITAENGAVAIDLLNAADRLPDIILMDVEMPVKDGIQALREIRKSVRYGQLPVIMITSRTGLKHRAMAQAAGCNGYMGKPFNFRMLIGQINELTGHRLQLS